jgi:hypothetical protein
MKISFKVLLVLALSFSSNAFAAVQGSWVGWATWQYEGQGTRCTANLNFAETSKTFVVKAGLLDCDIITMDIPERRFTKVGDQLTLEKKIVGKWNPTHFEWTERYNERTIIQASITTDGNSMDYVEHWIQDDNTLLYDVSGRLFKQDWIKQTR